MAIEFDEEPRGAYMNSTRFESSHESVITRTLIKMGFVSDKKSANQLLLVVLIICIIAIAAILWYQSQYLSNTKVQYELSPGVMQRLPFDLQEKIQYGN